jgi:hypothetical protein
VSYLVAYIPKGQTQFVAYTTRTQTSPITNVTAIQASTDTGGTVKQTGDGEFTYTFRQKAMPPSASGAYDATTTHRVGIYGSRNLTEFDLGTNYDDDFLTWVPAGGASVPRDVVRTATCNKCHDQMAFHGGSRRSMEICTMCHTPQTVDPDTGNTVDMVTMTHKIHMGEELPSVQAGKPYQIIGFNHTPNSTVTMTLNYNINFNSTTLASSGSIRFSLWAVSSAFSDSQSTLSGFRMANFNPNFSVPPAASSNQLFDNQSSNGTITATATMPPSGTYCFVLALDMVSSTCPNFCFNDWIQFSGAETY